MKLYNTLSRKIEEIPKKDHLNLYTCGPTVYNFAHIGNLRSYIMSDLLYRALKYEGYNPKWVMNITDIDDKTIKGAVLEFGSGATVDDLKKHTNKYFEAFKSDLENVNVLVSDITFIKVTDVIPEIQKYIVDLIDKGYAYKAEDGSTYFSIEKYQQDFGDYGGLVGEKFLEGKKVGARVAVDEYEKDNLSDFALWKAWDETSDAQIFWEHPLLGKGRPGWHIECSVINQIGFKGETTDIHTGGVDLIFPHHTNEIAQSQPMYKPFVNVWSHCEHLQVDGQRMGKRFNNFYTISDLQAKGFSGIDLRYFFLTSGFNNQQNFTWEALLASKNAKEKIWTLSKVDIVPGFKEAVSENLNFSQALAKAWEQQSISQEIENVLGIKKEQVQKVPEEIIQLMELRTTAKSQKDFAKSDELRKKIESLGYEVMDTKEGQKVKQKVVLLKN